MSQAGSCRKRTLRGAWRVPRPAVHAILPAASDTSRNDASISRSSDTVVTLKLRDDGPVAHDKRPIALSRIRCRRVEYQTIARPSAASSREQAVEVGLGAKVDSTRRVVEQDDVGLGGERPCYHHLLLIAARKARLTGAAPEAARILSLANHLDVRSTTCAIDIKPQRVSRRRLEIAIFSVIDQSRENALCRAIARDECNSTPNSDFIAGASAKPRTSNGVLGAALRLRGPAKPTISPRATEETDSAQDPGADVRNFDQSVSSLGSCGCCSTVLQPACLPEARSAGIARCCSCCPSRRAGHSASPRSDRPLREIPASGEK